MAAVIDMLIDLVTGMSIMVGGTGCGLISNFVYGLGVRFCGDIVTVHRVRLGCGHWHLNSPLFISSVLMLMRLLIGVSGGCLMLVSRVGIVIGHELFPSMPRTGAFCLSSNTS